MKARIETAGYVAPGFGPVADAFAENFERRGEIGAAFAAYRGDDVLVDMVAGIADRTSGRRWQADTLSMVFSGTKGFTAICALLLIERGQLSLDSPICDYWPAFGKPSILVRDVFGHTARLPGYRETVTVDQLIDDRRMADLLARQEPFDDPRAAMCYHALTYGWLASGLIRRIDGRSVGVFFREEIADPLGLDIWIGLPAALESRVCRLELDADWGKSATINPDSYGKDPLLDAIWANPEILTRRSFPWNEPAFHAAELPAVNGIGTARSIARLYSSLANDGDAAILSEETVKLARAPLSEGFDQIHGEYRRFGVGFQLQTADQAYGPPPEAFGHGGAGGSLHGAWPDHGIGFSYTMNKMRDNSCYDPPGKALLNALHGCA